MKQQVDLDFLSRAKLQRDLALRRKAALEKSIGILEPSFGADRELVRAARAELTNVERQLAALKESIDILDPIYGEDWLENVPDWAIGAAELGLTDKIRRLLLFNPKFVSPTQVRDWLVANGHDFGQQENPLASIHTILKRITSGRDPRFERRETDEGTFYGSAKGSKP